MQKKYGRQNKLRIQSYLRRVTFDSDLQLRGQSGRQYYSKPDCLRPSATPSGTMNVIHKLMIIITSVLIASVSPEIQDWPFDSAANSIQSFINNQTEDMRAFLEGQRIRVEKVLNSSYENAVKMKDSVNNYVEEQQRKISSDVNNYVQSVKDSGRKITDSWSYLPQDDSASRLENPDVVLSVPSIITRNGYPCETHTVESQGYVLNIHRIPHPKNTNHVPSKTVLLQHGLFASSADWILNGPEKALAYTLVNAGYDVWMSNIRGNRYCKEHLWLKNDSKSYWNFSWHDIALHDIPAVIDHIMDVKGRGTKITYIGHSMGTTMLFAMLTLRPEYNEKLKTAIALAPVVYMSDLKTPLKSMAPIASNVAYMEMLYGSHEFMPKNSALGRMASSCEVDNMDSLVCKNIIFYICGYNEKQFNKTLLPVFLAHLGTGTSWKTAVHFAQEVTSGGKFQQFDYGSYHNNRIYGTETPPEYDLSKITLPITLIWSRNDLLSSEQDVLKLHEKLPSTTELYMVPDAEFNHLDYLWAIDAITLVNNKILDTLKKNEGTEFGFSFGLNNFR